MLNYDDRYSERKKENWMVGVVAAQVGQRHRAWEDLRQSGVLSGNKNQLT